MAKYEVLASCRPHRGANCVKGQVVELSDDVAAALGPKFLAEVADKQVKGSEVKTAKADEPKKVKKSSEKVK